MTKKGSVIMTVQYTDGYYSIANAIGIIFRVYENGQTAYRWSNEDTWNESEDLDYTIHGDPFISIGDQSYMLEDIMRLEH